MSVVDAVQPPPERLASSVRGSGPCLADKGMAIRSPGDDEANVEAGLGGFAWLEVPPGGTAFVPVAGLPEMGAGEPRGAAGPE